MGKEGKESWNTGCAGAAAAAAADEEEDEEDEDDPPLPPRPLQSVPAKAASIAVCWGLGRIVAVVATVLPVEETDAPRWTPSRSDDEDDEAAPPRGLPADPPAAGSGCWCEGTASTGKIEQTIRLGDPRESGTTLTLA
jgi:hypothetical protein